MSLGNYSHQALLNYMFSKTSNFDVQPGVWTALSTTDASSGVPAGFTEATGTGYARKSTVAGDWNAATLADPSVLDNLNAIVYATAGGDWSSASNFIYTGIYDALTVGNFLGGGQHTVDKPVLNGDTAQYNAGDLDIQFDWLA